MNRDRSGKQIRHLKHEIKRLRAENKRLKAGTKMNSQDDTDESESDNELTPCIHCKSGVMVPILIIDKPYHHCINCGRTKKLTN